jgi:hypothetical protein
MSATKKKAPAKAPDADDPTVDQFLVALQKTFSRVSRDSAEIPEGDARALIMGPVEFEVSVPCALDGDRLMLMSTGGTALRLKGTISPDLGVELDEESANG